MVEGEDAFDFNDGNIQGLGAYGNIPGSDIAMLVLNLPQEIEQIDAVKCFQVIKG